MARKFDFQREGKGLRISIKEDELSRRRLSVAFQVSMNFYD